MFKINNHHLTSSKFLAGQDAFGIHYSLPSLADILKLMFFEFVNSLSTILHFKRQILIIENNKSLTENNHNVGKTKQSCTLKTSL